MLIDDRVGVAILLDNFTLGVGTISPLNKLLNTDSCEVVASCRIFCNPELVLPRFAARDPWNVAKLD